ncbi:MAG TPA: septum site-determining protein MinC [Caldisericia bacterium]|nr:septum site-determining protein MinC [Caldisericia bacterium]HPF49399.1 septum site-determining protein MinC [Caldisericia bacterium]HPI84398.1 septum site-determining protein MinC [Caldisericia bacterium]HPQ93570.1 septum site-determining protein MinC [Caldisericia bacterium]HRV75539.1 septum site-determining protein MinC [Caldisericia bacterium]
MARKKTPEEAVAIRGGLEGITVVLDDEYPMQTLFNMLEKRVRANKKFFTESAIKVNLRSRNFEKSEFEYIKGVLKYKFDVDVLTSTPPMGAGSVSTPEKHVEILEKPAHQPQQLVTQSKSIAPSSGCKVVTHTLRAGQMVESESDIVVLGDVNPGAEVKAGKNVFIYGILRGRVTAGANGEPGAYVVALDFEPVQLRIGTKVATSPASGMKRELKPQKAYLHENSIVVEFLR